jgi:hypothetical protein
MSFNSDLALAIGVLLALGCSAHTGLPPPSVPLSSPTELCTRGHASSCRQVSEVMAWMMAPDLRIVQVEDTPRGTQGAKVLTLVTHAHGSPVAFRAKWRSLASGGLFNDPRKEIAAYAIQSLFLSADDYVVPPTTGHCFPMDEAKRALDPEAVPSFEGTDCVCGVLSYWLSDAATLEDAEKRGTLREASLVDERLFEQNPFYRDSVANLNLLTFLIRHGDAHEDQFLLTGLPDAPHVYSVDNSIAFESIQNPMLLFREDWSTLVVPALSRDSLDRLAKATAGDLERTTVLEEYEVHDGVLVRVASTPPMGDADSTMRWIGMRLQVGLSRAELDGVRARADDVISRVDRGEIATFVSSGNVSGGRDLRAHAVAR